VQSKARKDILQAIEEDVLRDAVGGAENDLPAVKSILVDLAERDVDAESAPAFSCCL
jgi:hypothetical protein